MYRWQRTGKYNFIYVHNVTKWQVQKVNWMLRETNREKIVSKDSGNCAQRRKWHFTTSNKSGVALVFDFFQLHTSNLQNDMIWCCVRVCLLLCWSYQYILLSFVFLLFWPIFWNCNGKIIKHDHDVAKFVCMNRKLWMMNDSNDDCDYDYVYQVNWIHRE